MNRCIITNQLRGRGGCILKQKFFIIYILISMKSI